MERVREWIFNKISPWSERLTNTWTFSFVFHSEKHSFRLRTSRAPWRACFQKKFLPISSFCRKWNLCDVLLHLPMTPRADSNSSPSRTADLKPYIFKDVRSNGHLFPKGVKSIIHSRINTAFNEVLRRCNGNSHECRFRNWFSISRDLEEMTPRQKSLIFRSRIRVHFQKAPSPFELIRIITPTLVRERTCRYVILECTTLDLLKTARRDLTPSEEERFVYVISAIFG